MGRRAETKDLNSPSLSRLPSPSHSFSSSTSSDFEFTISSSPHKSSISSSTLCPADELFYKGQLLPLHLSPRLSMVRTLLLASSSISSSSDTTTTASRDSTGSSSNESNSSFSSDLLLLADCDSSRPSSVTEEDEEFKQRLNHNYNPSDSNNHHQNHIKQKPKYFSLSRFSSVFRKDATTTTTTKSRDQENVSGSSMKRRMSASAKEVLSKYLKKVKPLYEKLSQKQHQQNMGSVKMREKSGGKDNVEICVSNSNTKRKEESNEVLISHSFSGNLRYPRRRKSCISSCPSSIRSSPNHSGILCRNRVIGSGGGGGSGGGMSFSDKSTMEELQNAVQGAIAHCKNSMVQTAAKTASKEI